MCWNRWDVSRASSVINDRRCLKWVKNFAGLGPEDQWLHSDWYESIGCSDAGILDMFLAAIIITLGKCNYYYYPLKLLTSNHTYWCHLVNKLKLCCALANRWNLHVWNSHHQHAAGLFRTMSCSRSNQLLLSNSSDCLVDACHRRQVAIVYTETQCFNSNFLSKLELASCPLISFSIRSATEPNKPKQNPTYQSHTPSSSNKSSHNFAHTLSSLFFL